MQKMSLEAFHPSCPSDALSTHNHEFFVFPATSPHMERVVTQLATVCGVDLAQHGATFNIDAPEYFRRWLIGNIDGERIGITRCQMDKNELMMPDLDMVFAITWQGWEPREIVHSDQVWQTYVAAMQASGRPLNNEQGDFNFALFADFIAQDLAQLANRPFVSAQTRETMQIFSSDQEAEGGAV